MFCLWFDAGSKRSASLGMPLIVLLELIQTVAESGKLAISDMVDSVRRSTHRSKVRG